MSCKKLLSLLVLLSASSLAMAQFTVTPNPNYASGPRNTALKHDGIIKNTSTVDSVFTWIRIQQLPSGWTSQICDPITCWADVKDSSTFTLSPGDSNILYVSANPNNNGGSTTVKLFVYQNGKRAMGDTIYYNFSTWALGSNKVVNRKELSVYPNPAQLSVNFRYETATPLKGDLYNIIGTRVKSFTHDGFESNLSLEDLPKGIYIVKLYDAGKVITKTFTKN